MNKLISITVSLLFQALFILWIILLITAFRGDKQEHSMILNTYDLMESLSAESFTHQKAYATIVVQEKTPIDYVSNMTGAWELIRQCESSGNYAAVNPAGYYGAYQFDLATWQSVGGTGRPDQAPPAEQDTRAQMLYDARGWQPWECAYKVGLL